MCVSVLLFRVRDTGNFTPMRLSPTPSVRTASVAGDESPSDVNVGDVGWSW